MHLLSDINRDVRHPKTHPGSYEWWYFDGISDDGKYQFVVIFYDGCPFSTRYIKSLEADPSHPDSMPDKHPAISISVYEKGKPIFYSLSEYPPDACRFDEDMPGVMIGENSLRYSAVEAHGSTGFSSLDLRINEKLPSGDELKGIITFHAMNIWDRLLGESPPMATFRSATEQTAGPGTEQTTGPGTGQNAGSDTADVARTPGRSSVGSDTSPAALSAGQTTAGECTKTLAKATGGTDALSQKDQPTLFDQEIDGAGGDHGSHGLTGEQEPSHGGRQESARVDQQKPPHSGQQEPASSGKDAARSSSGSGHYWNLVMPRAKVQCRMNLLKNGLITRDLLFNGTGYHDHNRGSEPMKNEFRDWYWGRVHFEQATLVYYIMNKSDGSEHKAWLLSRDNRRLLHELKLEKSTSKRLTPFLLRPARKMLFSDQGLSVSVHHQKVIDSGPFYCRYLSKVTLEHPKLYTETETGVGEYIFPNRIHTRLYWPLVQMRLRYTGEKPHWVQKSPRLYRWTW